MQCAQLPGVGHTCSAYRNQALLVGGRAPALYHLALKELKLCDFWPVISTSKFQTVFLLRSAPELVPASPTVTAVPPSIERQSGNRRPLLYRRSLQPVWSTARINWARRNCNGGLRGRFPWRTESLEKASEPTEAGSAFGMVATLAHSQA
jgi:hypothetical protein